MNLYSAISFSDFLQNAESPINASVNHVTDNDVLDWILDGKTGDQVYREVRMETHYSKLFGPARPSDWDLQRIARAVNMTKQLRLYTGTEISYSQSYALRKDGTMWVTDLICNVPAGAYAQVLASIDAFCTYLLQNRRDVLLAMSREILNNIPDLSAYGLPGKNANIYVSCGRNFVDTCDKVLCRFAAFGLPDLREHDCVLGLTKAMAVILSQTSYEINSEPPYRTISIKSSIKPMTPPPSYTAW